MATINNEARRARHRLTILSTDGIYGVITDLLEEMKDGSNLNTAIARLKHRYKSVIADNTPSTLEQSHLNFNKDGTNNLSQGK